MENSRPKKIEKSYREYLARELNFSNDNEKNKTIDSIINKGKKIILRMNEIKNQEERKGLIVGQVQSGKTINFMSVILNAILDNTNLIFIFSSIEIDLHKQTIDRISKAFDKKKNINFLKIYDLSDKDTEKKFKSNQIENRISLNQSIENEVISIFVLLKNKQKLKVIKDFFSDESFKNKKILIIDDEGDLASMSKTKKQNSVTLSNINDFFKMFNNAKYISVTATPQVHFMVSNSHPMIPKKVFCVEPGKNYCGLEIFENDKFYCTVNDKTNEESLDKMLKECILYYFIAWVIIMHEEEYERDYVHSHLLIHTNVKQSEHENYRKRIDQYINNLLNSIKNKNDISYEYLFKEINELIKKYDLPNLTKRDDFREKLEKVISWCQIKIINEKYNDKVNDENTAIVIGSKKLERGITLENLISTYFINRSERNDIAIDTLLQRARWFGYRSNIIKYLKIFTTEQIKNDFKEVKRINDIIWNQLKITDENNYNFDEIDRDILVREEYKLRPTTKVPLKINWSINQSNSFINYLKEYVNDFKRIFNSLRKSNDKVFFSDKYWYKCISYKNINDFFNEFNELKKIIFNNSNKTDTNKKEDKIALENYLLIENSKDIEFKVVLLDNVDDPSRSTPRIRGCYKLNDNEYKIKNLFQGENNSKNDYIGDSKWNEKKEFEKTVFLQIHYIQPKNENKEDISNEPIFAWSILIPKKIASKFKSYSPIDEDEDDYNNLN